MAVNNPTLRLVNGTVDNSPIGATTPSTGVFTTLTANSTFQFGASSANYAQGTGGSAGNVVQFQTLGSDSNVSLAIQPKGTGAIDLAAGSKGVNISNGGTVTAITGTTTGSYTVVPTITISAPTTAGGTQATGTVGMQGITTTLNSGGSGYAIGDTITLTGGTFSQAVVLTVATLSGSAVATFTTSVAGTYTVLPSNPVAQGSTSGSGSGATFNITAWGVRTTAYTITNAGSGYVEQPTVTFSSGTATAYAIVGSGTIVKGLGSSTSFYTPNGEVLRLNDVASATPSYFQLESGTTSANLRIQGGTTSNTSFNLASKGTGSFTFSSQGTIGNYQFQIAHTTSAVNYVQVTGGATGSGVAISSQGSDTSVGLVLQAKGASGTIGFGNASGLNNQAFRVSTGTATNTGNLILVTGAASGSSPSISAISGTSGSDTNIDLALTPKGTGLVKFGTYTAGAPTATGYISIKAADGTTYKVLVGT